jgi:hypothetical protein
MLTLKGPFKEDGGLRTKGMESRGFPMLIGQIVWTHFLTSSMVVQLMQIRAAVFFLRLALVNAR